MTVRLFDSVYYVRSNPTLNRWLDIILLSLVTSCLLSLAAPLLKVIVTFYATYFSEHYYLIFVQNMLLVMSGTAFLFKLGGIHPMFKLATILRYPPTWLASLLSLLVLCVGYYIFQYEFHQVPYTVPYVLFFNLMLISINAFAICVVFGLLYYVLVGSIFKKTTSTNTPSIIFLFGNTLFWTLTLSVVILLSIWFGDQVIHSLNDELHVFLNLDIDYRTFSYSVVTLNIGIMVSLIMSLLLEPFISTRHKIMPALEGVNVFDDNEALRRWILEERPLISPGEDILGYDIIAKKIARTILRNDHTNIGIIGSYGSGKSSVINLTKYYLTENKNAVRESADGLPNDENLVICSVDGWGLISKSVAKNILEELLEELKVHVDCLSILGLPENYRKALSGSKAIGGDIISPLFEYSQSALKLLIKLDNILCAAGLRVVIFLEDLDRNSSDEIIRDEVPALLDKLRKLKCLTFVLAIGTERSYSDFVIRICEKTESI